MDIAPGLRVLTCARHPFCLRSQRCHRPPSRPLLHFRQYGKPSEPAGWSPPAAPTACSCRAPRLSSALCLLAWRRRAALAAPDTAAALARKCCVSPPGASMRGISGYLLFSFGWWSLYTIQSRPPHCPSPHAPPFSSGAAAVARIAAACTTPHRRAAAAAAARSRSTLARCLPKPSNVS